MMTKLHPNDIGLATFEDVGDVKKLRTEAKKVVDAINELAGGSKDVGSIIGKQWYIDGNDNIIIGTNNLVYGNNNLVIGSNNIVVADNINLVCNSNKLYKTSNLSPSSFDIQTNRLEIFVPPIDGYVMPLKVGDKILLSFMQEWTDEEKTEFSFIRTPFKLAEITEVNTEENYVIVTGLEFSASPNPELPVLLNQSLAETIFLFDESKETTLGNNLIFGGKPVGENSFAVGNGQAKGKISFATNYSTALGNYSAALCSSYSVGDFSFSANSGKAYAMHSASLNGGENYSPYSTVIGYGARIYARPLKCIYLDETKYELTVDETEDLSGLTGKEIYIRLYNKSNSFTLNRATIESITGNTIKLKDISLGAGEYAYKLFPESYAFVPETSVSKSSGNFAGGYYSIASNKYTLSHGCHVMSVAEGASIFGKYGNLYEPYALALANGTSLKAPGLAFKVLSDGSVHADAEYTTPCADYAEFFEWEDGNPLSEDRVGYFVKLNGEKIVKCDEFDKPLGIVSATPAIIGDSGELHWKDKYVTDDFGRIQYHDVLVPAEYDEENNLISEEHMERQPIINPNWDSTKEYIPRKDRAEWSPVGVLGKLIVYDDGTLKGGDVCRPGKDGIAVKSIENGYPVLKRIAENKVLVWFKG